MFVVPPTRIQDLVRARQRYDIFPVGTVSRLRTSICP